MRQLLNGIIVLSCLGLVGCNQLTRLGSQALVFDSDPFTDIDSTARTPQTIVGQPANAAGRVSVGNLTAQSPPPTYADMQNQMQNRMQSTARPQVAQYNYPPTYDTAPMAQPAAPAQPTATPPPVAQPVGNPYAAAPAPPAISSPAARAAEEAAAMIAQRGLAPKGVPAVPVTQVSTAGTAMYGADPFEPANGPVPMPPEAQYDPNSQ